MIIKKLFLATMTGFLLLLYSCSSDHGFEGKWDFELNNGIGFMKLDKKGNAYTGEMISYKIGKIPMDNIIIQGDSLTAEVKINGNAMKMAGVFQKDSFSGYVIDRQDVRKLVASRANKEYFPAKKGNIKYMLSDKELMEYEKHLDHAKMIDGFDDEGYKSGERIYNANCINCHGTPEMAGSVPMSRKFWSEPFKAGGDPYSLYQTVTKGYGSMPPQTTLTPREKYDAILYIRENFVRGKNSAAYYKISPRYLEELPAGDTSGPPVKPYHPWSDMNYGNFLINTYELADSANGPNRVHSKGPYPFPDENYLKNNFAYKGIAVRLDEGPGGISAGNSWMIFDHDVLRVAGGWTGNGFIDWQGILLNGKHETYPRTIGRLHFETPVGPGWANPATGSFEDFRFKARDGRRFGPLPKEWANFKGIYYNGDKVIISYTVGDARILERLGKEDFNGHVVFTRTLNISPSSKNLKSRIASEKTNVSISGQGGNLTKADGYVVLEIPKGQKANIKLFISDPEVSGLEGFAQKSVAPEMLEQYTKGGKAHYPEMVTTFINAENGDGPIAVDELTPPFENPWKSRMRLSGIDFMKDANKAVVCTTDGDIWSISGLTSGNNQLAWKRIGSGLFQPLGIKVVNDKVYVTCRDQLVLLHDLNGDGETDYYESFNHDHQVTDHFHEFAMGLQTDKKGNFYYAKSGRHGREALIPQHGALIKVSKDGSKSEIIASGFRAANGVCINPDGSLLVTDQQGFWTPMNRINWIEGKGKFYGNMWGYHPPKDSSRKAMMPPIVWIDMEFDRSPSELLWVDNKKWGPLNGGLLSFSYGFGKVQLVLPEKVKDQRQAGVVDLPGIKFLTGVMRGRFNPEDGNLYACGMSAWGTNQVMRDGEFYRLRYTSKPLSVPVKLGADDDGMEMTFASPLDVEKTVDSNNFKVQTWGLLRSSKYGSERYNTQTLQISKISIGANGKTVKIFLPEIKPVDVMTISYKVTDKQGNVFNGKVQNTIYRLRNSNRGIN
jgi:cytochrome c5